MTEQPNETRDGAATPRTDAEAKSWCEQTYHVVVSADFSRTLERELNAAKAAREWRPIETAPRDGRWILGKTESGKCVVVRPVGIAMWYDDNQNYRDPKHWQPLPPTDAAIKPDQTQV
jgi:hypothetical protein